jgi:hypothetical protein
MVSHPVGLRTLALVPFEPLDSVEIRIPFQPELRGWRHVAGERRSGHDGRAGEVTFAADAHAILPVAIERRDRALTRPERIWSLTEARTAPRLSNLAARLTEYRSNGLAAESRVGSLNQSSDTT